MHLFEQGMRLHPLICFLASLVTGLTLWLIFWAAYFKIVDGTFWWPTLHAPIWRHLAPDGGPRDELNNDELWILYAPCWMLL
jgi:hypothetical protein